MKTASRRRLARPRLSVEALEGRALLAVAGSLDPAFGGGYGFATTSTGIARPSVNYVVRPDSVVTGPGGEIVVTGTVATQAYGTNGVAVAVFNADGTPDTSFGTDGVALLALPLYSGTVATVVQSNGQIIVAAGSNSSGDFAPESPTYFAFRLDADGSLDTTYGTGGVAYYPSTATTATSGRLTSIGAAALQPDGDLVLVGSALSGAFAAVRLDTTGSLDSTYGTGGTVDVPVSLPDAAYPDILRTDDTAVAAAVQSDGQVVVLGSAVYYESTGGGIEAFDQGSALAAFRLTTAGSLDTTFGGSSAAGTVVVYPYAGSTTEVGVNQPTGLAITPAGPILIAANDQTTPPSGVGIPVPLSQGTLTELNSDGTFNASFGTGGRLTPEIYGDVASLPGGQIVLAGGGFVERLNADGSPDATFGNTGVPGLASAMTGAVTLQPELAIDPTSGDVFVAGQGTVTSLQGPFQGLSVARVLAAPATGTLTPPPLLPPASLDGSGLTDPAVYNPTYGVIQYYAYGSTSLTGLSLGTAGAGLTIPAVANYAGGSQDQLADYLTSTGTYQVEGVSLPFGIPGAGQTIPVPADYYGTGQADIAIYMPAVGAFAIKDPTGKTLGVTVSFGIPGVGQSIPAPADYFGTGQADIAVYLTQAGAYAIRDPQTNQDYIIPYGKPGVGQSIPVPGDYDGSGHDELAVYIPSFGAYIYTAANGAQVIVPIGTANSGEIPVPGDYDGSGRTEAAVYNQDGGFIEYEPAKGGPEVKISIGTANSGSLPAAGPLGALPMFGAYLPGSGSGSGIRADAATLPSTATSGPASFAPASTRAVVVPAGPTLASARVPRTLINQADPDSSGSGGDLA